jgi:hypothetical protein
MYLQQQQQQWSSSERKNASSAAQCRCFGGPRSGAWAAYEQHTVCLAAGVLLLLLLHHRPAIQLQELQHSRCHTNNPVTCAVAPK